jgi:F420-0:gamma-glutamyl ligase
MDRPFSDGMLVVAVGEANMAICSDHIADQFDCLAVTLEMPYSAMARNLIESAVACQ